MQTCHHEPEVHPSIYQFTGTEPGEPLPTSADGGYPLYYLDTEENILCAPCATDVGSYSTCTNAVGVHYEGEPITCDNCSAVIESAYGDPDTDN